MVTLYEASRTSYLNALTLALLYQLFQTLRMDQKDYRSQVLHSPYSVYASYLYPTDEIQSQYKQRVEAHKQEREMSTKIAA